MSQRHGVRSLVGADSLVETAFATLYIFIEEECQLAALDSTGIYLCGATDGAAFFDIGVDVIGVLHHEA